MKLKKVEKRSHKATRDKEKKHEDKRRRREKEKIKRAVQSDQGDSKDLRMRNNKMRKKINLCHRKTEKETEGMTKPFCL